MLTLKADIRQIFGRKTEKLRDKGIIPAILYGSKMKNLSLEVDLKEFEKIYKKSGESSLISLKTTLSDNSKSEKAKEFLVIIQEVKKDPLTGDPIHIDFYRPVLTEEIEVSVPLLFEGEAPAVKDLGGTLIKEIQEIEIKALPQDLPHEIKVDINGLKTFEDEILVKDLKLPENVKVQRDLENIVAIVAPPEKIEEEPEQPTEEETEEEEKTEEKEKTTTEEDKKERKETNKS